MIFREDIESYPNDIEIGLSETFEGREKDVIVISALKFANGFTSFPTQTHLLIALSRAKRALIFCGGFGHLQKTNLLYDTLQAIISDATQRNRFINVQCPANADDAIVKIKKD